MTKGGAFLVGFAVAAAAAAAVWFFLLRPHAADLDKRVVDAERAAQRAKRDASDAQQWADRERRRKLEVEEEAAGLKRLLEAAPPPPPMSGHAPAAATDGGLAPELWDGKKLRQEIMTLSLNPDRIVGNPRYPLVVRGLKSKPDESAALLKDILAQPMGDPMHAVAAVLFGALGDVRGVEPLLAAWGTAVDPTLRRALLRGLANLPGDAATPLLVAAWSDAKSDPTTRNLAIHGLARRRHEIALAVAEGGAPGSTPALRYRAIASLHAQAARAEWKDASLLALFGKALRTADGDGQRDLALAALEGYWSKDALPDLDAFADAAAKTDLGARARKDADAIRAGKPRPEGAGAPPTQPATAVPGEPEDAPTETKSDPKVPPK